MLWKRVLTALIPLPFILGLMHFGPTWGWLCFVGLTCVIGHWEFLTITRVTTSPAAKTFYAAVALAALCAFHYLPGYFGEIVVGLVLFSFISVLTRPGELATAFPRMAALTTSYLYVPLLMSFIVGLHALPLGVEWIYIAFFVSWLGDTGAFFAGRAFGRHKLYPLVSPKKTWEGAIGGLVGSLCGVIGAKLTFLPILSWADCVLIAIPGGVLGQVGDLCESLLKRSYDVKDSGAILPGHGGILDRADALIFVLPYVFFYATKLQPVMV